MTFLMKASMGRMLLWSAVVVCLWAAPARAGEVSGSVTRVLRRRNPRSPAQPPP